MRAGSFITSGRTNQRAEAWPAGREGASPARTGCEAREAEELLCFLLLKVLVHLLKESLRGLARCPIDT